MQKSNVIIARDILHSVFKGSITKFSTSLIEGKAIPAVKVTTESAIDRIQIQELEIFIEDYKRLNLNYKFSRSGKGITIAIFESVS